MKPCTIFTIANQKGGTAKTTTATNLGFAMANAGKRVLLVDFDPQANLSMSFGIEHPDKLAMPMHQILSMIISGDVLPDKSEYILPGEKLDIIQCNSNLTVTEVNLRNEIGAERTLHELLEPLRPFYEYIIIDSNPYLGLLTINALAACDKVIIPVSPQYWSATGLSDLMKTIIRVGERINPRISVDGILMTMCDERTTLFRAAKEMIEEFCAGKMKIYSSVIPNSVKIGMANYSSDNIMDFAPRTKAAKAYKSFADEVMGNE